MDVKDVSDIELMYLRAIASEGGPITITHLSRKLGRSASSVYEEVIHLMSKGLVEKRQDGVCLTENGVFILKLIENSHRIIETWLVRDLGFSIEDACRLASRMEKFMPLEVLERLYESLGNPQECPHGKPISFSGSISTKTQ